MGSWIVNCGESYLASSSIHFLLLFLIIWWSWQKPSIRSIFQNAFVIVCEVNSLVWLPFPFCLLLNFHFIFCLHLLESPLLSTLPYWTTTMFLFPTPLQSTLAIPEVRINSCVDCKIGFFLMKIAFFKIHWWKERHLDILVWLASETRIFVVKNLPWRLREQRLAWVVPSFALLLLLLLIGLFLNEQEQCKLSYNLSDLTDLFFPRDKFSFGSASSNASIEIPKIFISMGWMGTICWWKVEIIVVSLPASVQQIELSSVNPTWQKPSQSACVQTLLPQRYQMTLLSVWSDFVPFGDLRVGGNDLRKSCI